MNPREIAKSLEEVEEGINTAVDCMPEWSLGETRRHLFALQLTINHCREALAPYSSEETTMKTTHSDPFLGEVLNAANAMLNATAHRVHELGKKEEALLSPAERIEIRAWRRLADALLPHGKDRKTETNVFVFFDWDEEGVRAIVPAHDIEGDPEALSR